jgi:hypothetical protein
LTKPSITFGHGVQVDCNRTSGGAEGTWAEEGAEAANGTFSVLDDDYFDLENTGGAVDYGTYSGTDLTLDTDLYKYIKIRYKTSSASIKAKVVAEFTGAEGTQTVLAETSSTTFTVATVALDSGKTLDHLHLWANDAVGHVYYDFVFVYKNLFTFPNTQFGKRFIRAPCNAILEIPSRVGDITQNLGSHSARFECHCNLDRGSWKRLIADGYDANDYVNDQIIDEISHNSFQNSWNWLNTGMGRQFKVVLDEEPVTENLADRHSLDLVFREYRRSSASGETEIERFGMNL